MATHTIAEIVTLRYAAKQSEPFLRRAVNKYLQERVGPYMKRKVLGLSQSFNDIKNLTLPLATTASRKIVEDTLKSCKINSPYGDKFLAYRHEETDAYVASPMPMVYSVCYRLLQEVCRRPPGFSPAKVLNFGAGTISDFWALREVWPKFSEKINLIKPSQSMQRAGQNFIQEDWLKLQQADDDPREVVDKVTYDCDAMETGGGADDDDDEEDEEDEGENETASADLGGRSILMNEFRSTVVDVSEGSYDRTTLQQADDDAPGEVVDTVTSHDSDAMETDSGGGAAGDDDAGKAFEMRRVSSDLEGCRRCRLEKAFRAKPRPRLITVNGRYLPQRHSRPQSEYYERRLRRLALINQTPHQNCQWQIVASKKTL